MVSVTVESVGYDFHCPSWAVQFRFALQLFLGHISIFAKGPARYGGSGLGSLGSSSPNLYKPMVFKASVNKK